MTYPGDGEPLEEDDLPTRVERPGIDRDGEDELPTRAIERGDGEEPPSETAARARRDSEARTTGTSAASTTIASPREALRADEVERFRAFYWVILMTVGLMSAALPYLEGDTTGKAIFGVTLLGYAVGATWLRLRSRDPAEYHRDRNLIIGGLPGAFCGWAAIYFWGVFSPAPVVVAAALFINSLVGSLLYTTLLYVLLAAGHLTMALLLIAGELEDVGLIQAGEAALSTQVFTVCAVQFVMLVAFLGARKTRRVTLSHVAELERVAREMAQRDALLNEAREELKRAAWVGGPGRYTGQLVGSYKLGNIIGRGAMGEVYEAQHDQTGEPAALKLLHRNVLADRKAVERFSREAEAAASLDSPNVVKVLEVSAPEAATPYLAMERMRGHDLASVLRKRRRLELDRAVELVEHVARGLEAARAAEIVHRDLKPHNIFRDERDGGAAWKILDFGVSKLADRGGTLTSGAVVGTPAYMSPEQACGEQVDHRSDVYSLGAIAYRALTGHPPFPKRDVATTLHQVVYKMPERPGALVTLPREVDAVLAIAMAKRREERFESALELAENLRRAAEGSLKREVFHLADKILARLDWGKVTR